MANVHIRMIEDTRGDLVDIEYFHHGCSMDAAEWVMNPKPDIAEWPAPEAVDYPVYCEWCHERIESVPLTVFGAMQFRNDIS